MHTLGINGSSMRVTAVSEGIFRVRLSSTDEFKEPLLSKYGIIKGGGEGLPLQVSTHGEATVLTAGGYAVSVLKEMGALLFEGGKSSVRVLLAGRQGHPYRNEGFRLKLSLTESDRLFGLGDVDRNSLQRRGKTLHLWQQNVVAYGPIPFLMSSLGWGILINCTYSHKYDLGETDKNNVIIDSDKGVIDFYIFMGNTMAELLGLYTDISGKPLILPRYAYGLTFVCNESDGARQLLEDCVHFRKSKIPCDVMSLEPGWMEKHYDTSVDKSWSKERFFSLPAGKVIKDGTDITTFFYNLRKLGYKLSLWLCCDYDLIYEEEKHSIEIKEYEYEDAAFLDNHFARDVMMDKETKQGEPWFLHLKKFVDQGAAAFKLDGAYQVMKHPDRLWGGKYTDDEIHNIYPVIYSKQMKEGFQGHTGRRALIYSPCSYAGIQKYSAVWTGDTGGGNSTLLSVLNLAMCGQTNSTCDMEPTTIEGIHYGFLLTWSQMLAWRAWHHPWFLGEETENAISEYSNLRSSLFPYIYSMAHKANETGMPVVRPLPLVYEGESKYDKLTNVYMLGDSMLIGVFDMHITLPEGIWTDFFTGERYKGGCEIDYIPPENRGGAIFIKEGAVFVTQEPQPFLDKKSPEIYYIHVYPGKDGSFTLVEDDGITFDYEKGEKAKTEITLTHETDKIFNLTINEREGTYTVKSDEEYDLIRMRENHRANVRALPEPTGFEISVYTGVVPKSVTLNNKASEFTYIAEKGIIKLSADSEGHKKGELKLKIEL